MRSLAAILVACTLGLTLVAESHAAPPKHGIGVGVLKQNYRGGHAAKAPKTHAATPPEKPCRFENRLDVEIVDGIWFECSCEALMVGTVCDWYEITSPAHDPTAASKAKRKLKAKPKPKAHARRVAIHAPLPAVTG